MKKNLRKSEIREKVIDNLRTVYDPEIPVDIWELGLVYDVSVDDQGGVSISMTLTTPGCPVAESLPLEIKEKIGTLPEVTGVTVDIVWEPVWNMDKMSESARLTLGL